MASSRYFLILIAIVFIPPVPAAHLSKSVNFIKVSCSGTLYQKVCLSTLFLHANVIDCDPIRLASTALNLTTSAATSTLIVVVRTASGRGNLKPLEVAAFRDCIETMSEAVDELKRSNDVMAHIGGQTLGDQIDNMQTWVSAALTNGNTCVDSLHGPSAGATKERVLVVVQMASNALHFINALVAE